MYVLKAKSAECFTEAACCEGLGPSFHLQIAGKSPGSVALSETFTKGHCHDNTMPSSQTPI